MEKNKLNLILERHRKWIDGKGGERANLREANLREADLDYSCWPLWCGTLNVKVDKRIAMQLAAHFCVLDCDDPEYQEARQAILKFAQGSHRAVDLKLSEW